MGLKRKNSSVAHVSRRVQNGHYTKFGSNRLRGQRVNLEHTDRHTFAFIYTHTHTRTVYVFNCLLF
jgi:hypothetical protein